VVQRLVGAGFFAYAADRYLRAHPPAGPCLAEYGATFPPFLRAFEPAWSLTCLPDVARLEWAMAVALQADDAAPLDPAAPAAVPPEETAAMTLRFDPSVTYLASRWPVDRIWQANQPEHDPPQSDFFHFFLYEAHQHFAQELCVYEQFRHQQSPSRSMRRSSFNVWR
jgi:hypothetical protein